MEKEIKYTADLVRHLAFIYGNDFSRLLKADEKLALFIVDWVESGSTNARLKIVRKEFPNYYI